MEEIILKERELRETIVQAINSSGLPAIIIKPVLVDCITQITTLEQQQYEQAIIKKEKEEQNDKLQEQSEHGNTDKCGKSKSDAKD